MTYHEAAKIIKSYQLWRNGETEQTMDELGLTSSNITTALSVALIAIQDAIREQDDGK